MKKYNKILSSLMMLLALVFSFEKITQIFIPNGYYSDVQGEAHEATWDEFYSLDKNSIDVIYLGSSSMYHGISPLKIWSEVGVTGFDLGSSTQRPWVSLYFLEEALKTQKPKVIILDMYAWMWRGGAGAEAHAHKAYDYTNFSIEKIKSVQRTLKDPGFDCGNIFSYIMPAFRYHSRWNDLERKDFRQSVISPYKGMALGYAENDCTDAFSRFDTVREYSADVSVVEYFQKIVDLCNKNDIELVLIKLPVYEWGEIYSRQIAEFSEKNNLTFIDFNYMMEDLQIDVVSDFTDGSHLNVKGAEKISTWLAQWLVKNCSFIDKRQDSQYAQWNDDYQTYLQNGRNYQLQTCEDIGVYFDLLKGNPNYDLIAFSNVFPEKLENYKAYCGKVQMPFPEYCSVGQNIFMYIQSDMGIKYVKSDGMRVETNQATRNIELGKYEDNLSGLYSIEIKEEGGGVKIYDANNGIFLGKDITGNLIGTTDMGCEWHFKPQDNSMFTVCAEDGLVWDVVGGNMAKGVNVQCYEYNGSPAQKFYLYRVFENGEISLVKDAAQLQNGTYMFICSGVAIENEINQSKDGDSKYYFLQTNSAYELEKMLVNGENILFSNQGDLYMYVYDRKTGILVDKAVVDYAENLALIIHEPRT